MPSRQRKRIVRNAATAKARDACPLGKAGSNSAEHRYPASVFTFASASHGLGRSPRHLIASVETIVTARRSRTSNVALRRLRHHGGTTTRNISETTGRIEQKVMVRLTM